MQVVMIKAGFAAQRDFLVKVSKCKEPSKDVLQNLLKSTADKISDIQVSAWQSFYGAAVHCVSFLCDLLHINWTLMLPWWQNSFDHTYD